ncbi:unnamed protein product [Sphenostylis stenocarpa]|uniref:Late embryogenesis abundant protein LEA-2 subgroup domain-containing protein n=1 Tax=Sphenostylis stenocarpa TaxID=92480 RepID=A0AA86SE60_9FABA|nr:unnamed protein product [Sphenostylis stenocarpa]
MRISKASFYTLLLHKPYHRENLVVLSRRRVITCALSVALVLTTLYVLWPSNPDLKIVGLKLRRIKVHPVPPITVDISMLLTLRVRNADVYFMDLGAVNVAVAYRGKMLGHVRSREVHVRARGSSYVDADVEFAGISVVPELVVLLEDVAKGIVPFHTDSQTMGQLGLFLFHFPMKAKVSCEVVVSVINHTIIRQHCLHEFFTMSLENCHSVHDKKNKRSWSSYVRIFCTPFVCVDNLMTRFKIPNWTTFWRKIKREKSRLFNASPAVLVQYDPNSYSQNFDDGYSNDPDNLSRSFSARFAVPSKIFDKGETVCNGEKL